MVSTSLEEVWNSVARSPLIWAWTMSATSVTVMSMRLDFFLSTYGYNPAAASFSQDNLDAFILEAQLTYGITPRELWMSPADLGNFTALRTTQVVVERKDAGRGEHVTSYVTKYGHELKLSTDPHLTPKKLRLLDLEGQCELMPLQGRQLALLPMAKTGDNTRVQMLGEYTLEFRSPQQCAVMTLS